MLDIVEILRNDLQRVMKNARDRQGISQEEILYIFVKTRQVLERQNMKEKYQTLNLYCNWMLHTELSESSRGLQALVEISQALRTIYPISLSGQKNANDRVCEILSLKELRHEMIQVFLQIKVDKFLLDKYVFWNGFVQSFLREIREKRIAFPPSYNIKQKRGKKLDQLKQKMKNNEIILENLWLSSDGQGEQVHWNVSVLGSDDNVFRGPLMFTEDRSAFKES